MDRRQTVPGILSLTADSSGMQSDTVLWNSLCVVTHVTHVQIEGRGRLPLVNYQAVNVQCITVDNEQKTIGTGNRKQEKVKT